MKSIIKMMLQISNFIYLSNNIFKPFLTVFLFFYTLSILNMNYLSNENKGLILEINYCIIILIKNVYLFFYLK